MKKRYGLFIIISLIFFIPRVYAFSYDLKINASNKDVLVGSLKEIKVSLVDISNTSIGIDVCSMNILFDKNILLDSSVRTLNDWDVTTGNMYLFDNTPVLSDSDMFVIPVKVNGKGSVKLNNIVCTDGVEEISIENKEITFTIKETTNNNSQSSSNNSNNSNNSGNKDNNQAKDSNCNLSNIILSEGNIEFDSNVTEYNVKVNDLENFDITPVIENTNASYMIDKNISNNTKSFVVTVTAPSGDSKVYMVNAISNSNDLSNDDNSGENKYTIIFMIIIFILVVINIYRVAMKFKSNKNS